MHVLLFALAAITSLSGLVTPYGLVVRVSPKWCTHQRTSLLAEPTVLADSKHEQESSDRNRAAHARRLIATPADFAIR
jgi:hypothetical protein